MHVWKRVAGFIGVVVGFTLRRRRLTVAVGIAALLVGTARVHRRTESCLRAERARHRQSRR